MNRVARALGGVVGPEQALRRLDRFQQRHAWLGFPLAVFKKFGDDQAGNLAALIAYYAFASLLPLLLVFVTVLCIVLHNDPSLQDRLLNSAFGQFPGMKTQLENNVHSLSATGVALVIGLLFMFLGARALANVAQTALNKVWAVPYSQRPGFPWNQLRSIAMITIVGLGVIATSLLSGLIAGAGSALTGAGAHIGGVVISLVCNVGLFWLGFRLATAREVTTRQLFPSALASAVVWQVLQLIGGFFVAHELARSKSLYGIFGLVLGLLAWLFLQAQATLYAVEADVVRTRKLWPRSLAPPLTPQDRRAYALYVKTGQRIADEQIEVDVGAPVPPPVSARPVPGPAAKPQPRQRL
jgi:YihY family inner membrane protein